MNNRNMTVWWVVGLIVIAAIVGLLIAAAGDETEDVVESNLDDTTIVDDNVVEEANIVEVAQATPTLTTLVNAVVAAELVDTLADESATFTVFAPDDAAFEALPEGELERLLQPENQAELQDILLYHVVANEAMSTDLFDGMTITTVQGQELTVSITDEGVFLIDASGNTAQVTLADVDASNGVVHVINSVLLPASE